MTDYTQLPFNLPVPQDDGASSHLLEKSLPDVILLSTSGKPVDLSYIQGQAVFFCYPMTGQPGVELPNGWDSIPGARGCTPQSCSFRDRYRELQTLDTQVYGISTQKSSTQLEAVERLHIPYELLSDADFELTTSLQLPTFELENLRYIKRLTLIVRGSKIVKVFYPIFPPERNIVDVVEWLKQNKSRLQEFPYQKRSRFEQLQFR
ncbi:peroxiredoxin [Myxosarcina sp. GI1]|uniref:peroxiredoxin n=1 Tax=Myxosarcina sp. GI1 TaxID=1541065 RepID=UPI0006899F0E|nr:peroxiredoxin [Myxosarcina sp. GI1]